MEMHLDPDTLAAFAEDSLNPAQVSAVWSHLAECEPCRAYLAAYSELRTFEWTSSHLRRRHVSRSIAAAIAALWLISFFHPTPRVNPKVTTATIQNLAKRVTLTTVSFRHPNANQIVLKTALGDRWISTPGLPHFLPDRQHAN